ncbi:MAG TPA: LysR family transcriptional regulator [Xanthomonadales bacterium]|nr:LysR family transcriptional regulator [Xanthomonadales bacterium]
MSDTRLIGIEAFVAAVETGSFALAAARLGVTRSAVAKSVARLERRLGARLFQRTTRRQSLTEDGQAYYERCRRALAELDAAEAALAAGRSEPLGRLRVSAPLVFGRRIVAPVLSRLVARHAGLALELSFSDRVVDLVDEGFDLGVRIGVLRDSATLAARRLGTQEFIVCAAPAYLDQRGRPETPVAFAGHAAVTYARGGIDTPWLARDADGGMVELRVERRLRFDNLDAIADAALRGAGLARLPRWLAVPHLRAGELVQLGAHTGESESVIHAVWPQSRMLPSKLRVAIDALVAEVPPLIGTADAVLARSN